jgi:hypothetical protein
MACSRTALLHFTLLHHTEDCILLTRDEGGSNQINQTNYAEMEDFSSSGERVITLYGPTTGIALM